MLCNIKKMSKNRKKRGIQAFTYIEVLISLSVISFLFIVLIQTILAIYKSNQYISTVNKSLSETHYFTTLISNLIVSSQPASIDCTREFADFNSDGNADVTLVTFTTVFDQNEYKIVLLRTMQIPFKRNATYNALGLYRLNTTNNDYELLAVLTNPTVNIKQVTVTCSNLIEDRRQNAYIRSVTLQGKLDSTATYLFAPNMANTPIVQDLTFYDTFLSIN